MNTYELTVNGDQGSKLHLTTAYPNEIMRLLQLSGMAAQDAEVDVQPVVMEPTDTGCGCEDAHVMEQQAEYDYGHDVEDEGWKFGIRAYKFTGKADLPERLTSARYGANALKSEMKEHVSYDAIRSAYEAFLSESENEAGLMSPLTANHRDEFDHDPLGDEEPVTDGTHSPMSTIKLQDLPK